MKLIKRAYRIFSEDGLIPLFNASVSHIRSRTESVVKGRFPDAVYRFGLPEHIKLEVDGNKARFHKSGATLSYDFRNDFNSEKGTISDFTNELNEDDIIYDIGANIGLYSAFAGNIIDSGEIVAFEPQPSIAPILYRNLDANCESYNVVQVAVSDRCGFGRIQITPSTDASTNANDGIYISLKRLSNMIEEGVFPLPNVVKIDVEGAEREVLKGLDEHLSDLDLLYVEIHHEKVGEFGSKEYQVRNRLDETFDNVTTLGEQTRSTRVTHIKATDR
jgi:FkbM family methyltransferase